MALAQAKTDLTEARLSDVSLPEGAGWADAARKDALSRVRAMGLPTKRDQERMLHAINQLQSHVYDLQEQLEDVKNAKK